MPRLRKTKLKLNPLQAINKIANWWRSIRSSGKTIHFSENAHYSNDFKIYFNKQKNIPRKLTHFQDAALLKVIENGDWGSARLRDPHVHYGLMNLFAAGKITWEQKATLSDIIESTNTYGRCMAYPILDKNGEFSPEAQAYLLPHIQESVTRTHDELAWAALEHQLPKAIAALPLSESYFFFFPDQKLNDKGSSPSAHTILRNDFLTSVYDIGIHVIRAHKRELYSMSPQSENYFLESQLAQKSTEEYLKTITSATHLNHLQYEGIFKLSFGLENVIGQMQFGRRDWWTLVPRLAKQSINDIDDMSQKHILPTLSPESKLFGLANNEEKIHGGMHAYPEIVAHDDYHRKATVVQGNDIHQAIERIIQIARETFGYKWSKDIWLLRDFDLDSKYFSNPNIPALTTGMFVKALTTNYLSTQLENCDLKVKDKLTGNTIMIDEKGSPRQIALAFVIDLIRNPQIWHKFNIVNDEKEYAGTIYEVLIKMAKHLNKKGVFGQNMKDNVIKFNLFLKDQDLTKANWNSKKMQVARKLKEVKACTPEEIGKYHAIRDNRQVFLGFRKEAKRGARNDNHYRPKRQPEKRL